MRWCDVDGLGHVSHTAALTYLEEGRDAMLERHGIARNDYVIGRCSVTYLSEITLDEREVTASCEVAEVGRSSLATRERLIDAAGKVFVEAAFGLVLWDSEKRGSRPLTEDELASFSPAEEVSA
jgi:acyl-CoA thioesterase FadM